VKDSHKLLVFRQTIPHQTTEELLLGQIRGLLILANAHQVSGSFEVCKNYLVRCEEILITIEFMRLPQEKCVA